jgi:ABC-type Na+ efflux pump permease subunit
MHTFRSSLRVIWACLKKDLKSARSEPLYTLVSIILPLNVLVLMSLLVISGGLAPTAVVMQDTGPLAQQFYTAMSQAHSFVLQRATADQADTLIQQGKIVAVVTIPADFDARIRQNQSVAVGVKINNLNTDFTNDIRRAVPDAITQFYQQQGGESPIKVTLQEQNLRSQDIQLFQYSAMPLLVLLLVVSGLVSSSLSAAGEWETRTIKELLLSPASSGAIITGKVLTGFVTTMALGVLVLGAGSLLGWVQPQGVYWLQVLLIMALVALFSAGLGVALGALLQRIQPVGSAAIVLALYLFFLTGGTAVLAFDPGWLQTVATFVPLYYGRHALEMAIFYQSSDQLPRDVVALAGSALLAVGLGILATRRGLADSH